MESRVKHLEFIQNVIARMNSNSFLIKGWTITLVSALFALAAKDSQRNYVLISYFAIPSFWILDGFYLAQERRFRCLYIEVAKKPTDKIDFSMDTEKYASEMKNTWIGSICSKSFLVFYLTTIGIVLTVMFIISR